VRGVPLDIGDKQTPEYIIKACGDTNRGASRSSSTSRVQMPASMPFCCSNWIRRASIRKVANETLRNLTQEISRRQTSGKLVDLAKVRRLDSG